VTDLPERGRLAAMFTNPGVADAYRHRPPYPAEVFDILERLITDRPRRVLDIGAGEGALARPLASRVDHVDALDVSAAMIEAGRGRPGGRQPNLSWIVGAAETARLGGPYALITAGASLHWMSWPQTLARLVPVMTGRAVLAIVDHGPRDLPWHADLEQIIARYSRSSGYNMTFSLTGELAERGLLTVTGRATTAPVRFRQRAEDFVEQFHSTSSLAREGMPAEEAAAFDRAVTDLVRPYSAGGVLEMTVVADLVWGTPTP
jgi:ubiquinone/menaquinone biosynthesis C-methylase UbiE